MKISGKIETKSGEPIQGSTAMVIDGPGSWVDMAAVTGQDGSFSVDVEVAGTYTLQIFKDGKSKTFQIKTGDEKTLVF